MKLLAKLFGSKATANPTSVFGHAAKQELEGRVESLLLAHHSKHGAHTLLDAELRVIAIGTEVILAHEAHPEAIAEVKLRELPTVLAFLVVREDYLAVPRDVVSNIATEAARKLSRRIKSLLA
jgi:hypothetical protein